MPKTVTITDFTLAQICSINSFLDEVYAERGAALNAGERDPYKAKSITQTHKLVRVEAERRHALRMAPWDRMVDEASLAKREKVVIQAKWDDDGHFYPCTVKSVDAEGYRIVVRWVDGGTSQTTHITDVKLPKLPGKLVPTINPTLTWKRVDAIDPTVEDPGYALYADGRPIDDLSIQDSTAYGAGYSVNKYTSRSMTTLHEGKSLAKAKAAAEEYFCTKMQPGKQTSKPVVSALAASHVVAKVVGIKAGDSKREAAEKAIAVMKLADFSPREIRKAEKMLADAIRDGRA